MIQAAINNETELLLELQQGSQEAFTALYAHYSEKLYYNILSMVKDELTAEELVQDIFARIWRKKGSIQIRTGFGPYIFAVSRNRVFDFFQQEKRDRSLYEKIKMVATENYLHVEEALFAKENKELLDKAIASLPPQRRRAFELCKLEGLSYKEASEQMGISLSTLKDHMANARSAIKEYLITNRESMILLVFYVLWNKR